MKKPHGIHQHIFVCKGKVFLTEPAQGGAHTHLLKLGDDMAETNSADIDAKTITLVKSANSKSVSSDHRHTLEMFDGSIIESILPEDVGSVDVRKQLDLQVQSVVFDRTRFPRMEDAATWMDTHGLSIGKVTETPQNSIFQQQPRASFDPTSLRAIHHSDGVELVVGTLAAPATQNEQPVAWVEPTPIDPEEAAFDDLRDTLVSGYDVVSPEEATDLGGLKDSIAEELSELMHEMIEILPLIQCVLDHCLDEDVEQEVTMAACARAQSLISNLKDGLGLVKALKAKHKTDAEILKSVPNKFQHISFTAPAAVLKQVDTGLEWARGFGRGASTTELTRAEQVSAKAPLTPENTRRIRKFLKRQENSRGFLENGDPTNGEISWRLMGGDPGQRWITKVCEQMDAADRNILTSIHAKMPAICKSAKAMAELFEGTSFERLQLTLKSLALTSEKLSVATTLEGKDEPVQKALVPSDGMKAEDLQKSLKDRAEKFGVEITPDASLTFPKGFPQDLAMYGDPVNLKFPIDTLARTRNARVRFKQFAMEIYKETNSRAVVHERIVRRELTLGIKPDFDTEDALDALLPAALKDELKGGTPVMKEAAEPVAARQGAQSAEQELPITWEVHLHKSLEERIAFGIVLEPDITDLHGDTYDEPTVKEAAWAFMEDFANTGIQHELIVNDQVRILESYVAPTEMELQTDKGVVKVRKGTWLMTVRVRDPEIWADVKAQRLTGFSFGGVARVTALD